MNQARVDLAAAVGDYTLASCEPAAPPRLAPAPTLEHRHAQALAGFAQVQTVAKLDEWARWVKGFPFTQSQEDALEDAYHRNKARLTPA